MPRILIVCDIFPPAFAPRMGYLVKYIKEYGWEADILTTNSLADGGFDSLLGSERVLRVSAGEPRLITLWDKLSRLLWMKRQFVSQRRAFLQAAENQLDPKDYSLILCSAAYRLYVLYAAEIIAYRWGKPWIADLRDIHEQKPSIPSSYRGVKKCIIDGLNQHFISYILKLRNQSLAAASAVTTVTPWHASVLSASNANTLVIYNGFDPESYYPEASSRKKQFKVLYTGTVHHRNLQDPDLLFLATRRLMEEGIISEQSFRIQFYTPARYRINITSLESYPAVATLLDFCDYVDTSEVPQLLNKACIVLLLANKSHKNGPQGILTTKYFEYLAVERPILCVRSDEGLLEASIREANAGVAARTVEEAYDFILEKYREWQEKGYTTQVVNRDYVQQFSRKRQAGQFVDLCEKLTL
jgi:glycosyltransferase involved in cell wall biosynthesis